MHIKIDSNRYLIRDFLKEKEKIDLQIILKDLWNMKESYPLSFQSFLYNLDFYSDINMKGDKLETFD
ncbi:hypothetical protein [Mycoplasmopsis sturni]|uniref:hypothetical protein n=1 Tax=Mycoplasmopsis sturni TaxID=39047 RepID=UPI0005624E88|nr:hypothetical protein [Mycoplasmopsis sturni]